MLELLHDPGEDSNTSKSLPRFHISGSSNLWINHLKIHGRLVPVAKDESSVIVSNTSKDPSLAVNPNATALPIIQESINGSNAALLLNEAGPSGINASLNDLSLSTAVDRFSKAKKRAGTSFAEAQNMVDQSLASLFDNNEDIPLPEYSCTIQKEGFVYRLVEIEDFVSSSRKIYKNVYYVLWGTILKEYEFQPPDMVSLARV